jgi:hypothetical protein
MAELAMPCLASGLLDFNYPTVVDWFDFGELQHQDAILIIGGDVFGVYMLWQSEASAKGSVAEFAT